MRLEDPPVTDLDHGSPEPGDAFLLALARHAQAPLVTGDRALLESCRDLPVVAPADALPLIGG
jgi:predicted nucleic acid-binding protein